MRVLLSGIVGSSAYGLADENSDIDRIDDAVAIYALSDPRTPHDYRYVGRTIWTPQDRLKAHIQTAMARRPDGRWRNAVTHRAAWIRAMIRDGYHPIITVLAETTLERRVVVEQLWIAALKEAGYRLTNATSGGEGNHLYKATGQTRQRQSEANRRRYANNPAERELCRQRIVSRFGTEEGRRWLSEKALTQWSVPGAREAQSERLKAVCADPEFVKRRSDSLRHTLLETDRGQQIRKALSRRLAGEGNHTAKLTWEKVRQIRAEYAPGVITQKQLAERYGVEQSLISMIIRCEIWTQEPSGIAPLPPPTKRTAPVALTDELLAEVAATYRESLANGRPTKAVAQHFAVSTVRAAGWVAKARKRGLLGATKAGIAGDRP